MDCRLFGTKQLPNPMLACNCCPLRINFSEILIKMQNFSFTKMHLKILSAKWRLFCPRGDGSNLKWIHGEKTVRIFQVSNISDTTLWSQTAPEPGCRGDKSHDRNKTCSAVGQNVSYHVISICLDTWSICRHYNDVIMSAMASRITSLMIANSTVYSGAYQRKHQSSASLAFVWGIHRWPVNSPHKGPVTRKIRHHELFSLPH